MKQSGNDYLQAQNVAQVAVQVAHKEETGRVRTALPTLPRHCHQNGTGSLEIQLHLPYYCDVLADSNLSVMLTPVNHEKG